MLQLFVTCTNFYINIIFFLFCFKIFLYKHIPFVHKVMCCRVFLWNDKQFFTHTRGDKKVCGKNLPFLHRLINRAGITAHTLTHMQLIGYNMLDVSRLCALQLLSRQRYIVRTGPFYVAFWRFTTQPIKHQRFIILCYAVIAYIAFHTYLTTFILLCKLSKIYI